MNALIIVFTFFFMEVVAWATHKYVMHGFLWNLHEDHHIKNPESHLEKNDSFFLIFAIPAIILMAIGTFTSIPVVMPIGIGITIYGACYFLVHDVFIHQRLKIFRNSNNAYFRAIRRAHKIHHKHLGKEHGECFGMLIVPFKYLRAELKTK